MASPALAEDPAPPVAGENGWVGGNNGPEWLRSIPPCLIGSDVRFVDISSRAEWTLSSCKNDDSGQFGVRQLLSENLGEYWRSTGGGTPHSISIEFQKKTDVSFLFLYLDYNQDESYTPQMVVLQVGSSLSMMDYEFRVEFDKPVGWQKIDIRKEGGRPRRLYVLNLIVTQNFQNGKDSQIRRACVIGPADPAFPNLVARETQKPSPEGEGSVWMNHLPLR